MSIVLLTESSKQIFDKLATHPLQTWQWGEFRKKTGVKVIRLGRYENQKLIEIVQLTIHSIPSSPFSIGYIPKSSVPGKEMLLKLLSIGQENRCIFIKLEPEMIKEDRPSLLLTMKPPLDIRYSSHPLFTKYSFQLDLTRSEDELLQLMNAKTRYNIKVARKHNVVVKEDNTSGSFEKYLDLTFETTKRQGFFAHDRKYHSLMWETMKKDGLARLFTANYERDGKNHILAAWIVFLSNNVIYYPYGASSSLFRNVMASNLMMWEVIRWGKKHGAKLFDMWGALGPDPDPKDPWYGFHRFKEGYGPKLIEFIGSFDLVINPFLYRIYNAAYLTRNILLNLRALLK